MLRAYVHRTCVHACVRVYEICKVKLPGAMTYVYAAVKGAGHLVYAALLSTLMILNNASTTAHSLLLSPPTIHV